jgi:hypothetical protein
LGDFKNPELYHVALSFVIVPDVLAAKINEAIDAALKMCPEAAIDRELFFNQLLAHYNEHGEIPSFSITKKEPT